VYIYVNWNQNYNKEIITVWFERKIFTQNLIFKKPLKTKIRPFEVFAFLNQKTKKIFLKTFFHPWIVAVALNAPFFTPRV